MSRRKPDNKHLQLHFSLSGKALKVIIKQYVYKPDQWCIEQVKQNPDKDRLWAHFEYFHIQHSGRAGEVHARCHSVVRYK